MPETKLSARSTGFENLKNSPSKSKDFKAKKSHISRTPIRIGNMELLNLLLNSDSISLKYLLSSYSSNEKAKEKLLEALLTEDPYDINLDYSDIGKNETQKLLDTLLFNIGLRIVDDDEDSKEANKILKELKDNLLDDNDIEDDEEIDEDDDEEIDEDDDEEIDEEE